METQYGPLAGIWAKISRAEKHIEELGDAAKAFTESTPIIMAHTVDQNKGKSFWFYKEIKATPIELSIFIGDAIHNLRSSLDLLACQLVKLNIAEHNCADVHFPISDTAHKLKNTLDHAKLFRKDTVEILKELEPYREGKGHALWQIHRLDIQDKHRLLILAPAAINDMFVEVMPLGTDVPPAQFPLRNQWTMPKAGDIILAIDRSFHELSPDGKVDVKGKFVVDIAINEPEIVRCQPVLYTLEIFVNTVKFVIRRFEPLFSSKN